MKNIDDKLIEFMREYSAMERRPENASPLERQMFNLLSELHDDRIYTSLKTSASKTDFFVTGETLDFNLHNDIPYLDGMIRDCVDKFINLRLTMIYISNHRALVVIYNDLTGHFMRFYFVSAQNVQRRLNMNDFFCAAFDGRSTESARKGLHNVFGFIYNGLGHVFHADRDARYYNEVNECSKAYTFVKELHKTLQFDITEKDVEIR